VPGDIARGNRRSHRESRIEAARVELRDLEVKKKALENEIAGAEEKIGLYKTSSSPSGKNDEYQAMGHQIDATQARLARSRGASWRSCMRSTRRSGSSPRRRPSEGQHLGPRGPHQDVAGTRANLTAELKAAQAEVAAARTGAEAPKLRIYDRIATRNMPPSCRSAMASAAAVTEVSSEVESAAARRSRSLAALPTCDQCGRLVYWDT